MEGAAEPVCEYILE